MSHKFTLQENTAYICISYQFVTINFRSVFDKFLDQTMYRSMTVSQGNVLLQMCQKFQSKRYFKSMIFSVSNS
jgi:hypothetical protein